MWFHGIIGDRGFRILWLSGTPFATCGASEDRHPWDRAVLMMPSIVHRTMRSGVGNSLKPCVPNAPNSCHPVGRRECKPAVSGCSIRPGWVHFEVCGVVFGGVSGRDASKSLKLRHGFRSRDPTNRQIISRTLPEGFPAPSISASPASRQYPETQATATKRPRDRCGRGAS